MGGLTQLLREDAQLSMLRFGDVDNHCPAARKGLVLHAALRLGDALVMLSEDGGPAGRGVVSVALDFDDEAELRRSFDALAATGEPVMSVFDAPWGALFGVVEDEFGVLKRLGFLGC